MSEGRDRRLARLERRRGRKTRTLIIWWDAAKETREQALARRCPEGAPGNARLLYVRWLMPGEKAESAGG